MTNSKRIPAVTDEQIHTLRLTAANAGEWATVELCDLVLDGHQMGRDTSVDDATAKVAKLLGVELPQRPSAEQMRTFVRDEYTADICAIVVTNLTWHNSALLADADTWYAYRNAVAILVSEGSNVNNDSVHAFCIAAIRFYEHAPFTAADATRWGAAYRNVRSALEGV